MNKGNALIFVVIAGAVCYGMLAHDFIIWTRKYFWELLCRAFGRAGKG